MPARLALTLSCLLLCASNAAAAGWIDAVGTQWTIDLNSVRVSRAHPIEHSFDGGILGDRIVFDIRRTTDGVEGRLTLACARDRYSISMLGSHPLIDDEPASNWSLAALLSSTFCAQIDALPEAETMMPVGMP